jgi:hypothetical protein
VREEETLCTAIVWHKAIQLIKDNRKLMLKGYLKSTNL